MSSALKPLNYDYKEEQRRIAEDTRVAAEIQADVQEEMQTVAAGQQMASGQAAGGQPGAAPPGGAPAGGAPAGGAPAGGAAPPGPVSQMISGPGVPQTPQDMMAQADELAQQLLGMPTGTRRSEISALKQKNEVLASLVQAKMDRIRSDAKSQGGQQMMQQQFGQA